ncbi:MAG: NADH-quinone oxidoreductase subunit K [Desulfurococcales archaeon]|nr:NADH-quinone oxidoreductase subunit K [Desulfurococcales archaeon]
MAVIDAAVANIAVIAAAVLAGLAAYGMSSSRNLLRQLLAIEVLFNAFLLFIVVLASFNPAILTAYTILLISIVSGEVIVLVAVIAAFYRVAKSLDSTDLEEEGV